MAKHGNVISLASRRRNNTPAPRLATERRSAVSQLAALRTQITDCWWQLKAARACDDDGTVDSLHLELEALQHEAISAEVTSWQDLATLALVASIFGSEPLHDAADIRHACDRLIDATLQLGGGTNG